MDLTLTPQHEEFRTELQEWFGANKPEGRLEVPYSQSGR